MTTLEQEVRTLQKQVRRQRRWNIALGVMVVVGGLMAAKGIQEVPDVIQAKKFQVVNDEGKAVVNLLSVGGHGVITAHDKVGKLIFLAIPEISKTGLSHGTVITQNGKGELLVSLSATVDGEGTVVTENGKGGELVKIGVTKGKRGLVVTKNGKGGTLVEIGSSIEGQGAVKTENGKGGTLVELAATLGGEGVVKTKNGKGQRLVELGATTDGEGVIQTQNGKGQVTSALP